MPPRREQTAAIDAKVARRQFFACTRALPMRASHSWRARRYGVSSGPSGLHWVVMRVSVLLPVGGGQAPGGGLGGGAGAVAGLPIELRTSDASAPGGARPALRPPAEPPAAAPPPPATASERRAADALRDAPADGAAARHRRRGAGRRHARSDAARDGAGGDARRDGRRWPLAAAWSTPRCGEPPSRLAGQARRLPAEEHERADGEKDRPELVEA